MIITLHMDEIWRPISVAPQYMISNHGRVRGSRYAPRMTCMTAKFRHGYPHVNLSSDGKCCTVMIHRLVASEFIPNPELKPCVDHIDGNRANNHVDNLRWATYSENQRNKVDSRNTSGYKGVSYYKATGKWQAYITVLKVRSNLGYFLTAEEAARAYDAKARELHRQYAKLNFPDIV